MINTPTETQRTAPGKVYLIPSALYEGAQFVIPSYVLDAIKDCQAFFVENERSARRYLKSIWKEIQIDDYLWAAIHKAEGSAKQHFVDLLAKGMNIGIISEAGCPGIADPGQLLVAAAHRAGARVCPLVGPNAVLLALMASGMNGQQFRFLGYLPIDAQERIRAIKQMESFSLKNHCTQVFIETPYRNNQLLEMVIRTCQPNTLLCIAADLTSEKEFVQTKTMAAWKKAPPDLHKRPVIFCLLSEQ
ncbi:MAG: SAM-dependent methyltransferase [Chitinophagaceae bacterium]|nr:SAM-dependent methyltransferase [Chitinophagaceae bacterium]